MNDMTKIKEFTFIESYPNLAPNDYCDRMVTAFDNLEKNTSGWSGSEANGKGNRKDSSFFFNEERNSTIDLAIETNKILDIGLEKYINKYPSLEPLHYYSIAIKVQRTPPKGGFHIWHAEQGSGEMASRMLTWTIYLNDIPDGEGETEFLEYGMKIKPRKGTVCFFPASWTHTHRGNAVYTHDKYIATGWYHLIGAG